MQILRTALASLSFFACSTAWANLELHCQHVTTAPVVDGRGNDSVWTATQAVTTQDAIAGIDHQIRCAYSAGQVFILVRFPDPDENREHKPLIWNADQQRYVIGPQREDTLVLKWNMEPFFTDISLSADNAYKADIWYWKSVRTDPTGLADDKHQIYSDRPMKKSSPMLSKSDREFYLTRRGDAGSSAYQLSLPSGFVGEQLSGYTNRTPQGSRADVRAKGTWSNGWWTVEFARDLVTGHDDDVQFDDNRRFQFGVSRYEIAGRQPDPALQVPLFGSGEVGDDLVLTFKRDRIAGK